MNRWFRRLRAVALIGIAMAITSAASTAQAVLPTVERALPRILQPVEIDSTANAVAPSVAARIDVVRGLLRTHRDVLEADPRGEAIRRHQVLALVSSGAALDRARSAGFVVRQRRAMGALGDLYVLEVPAGQTTRAGLQRLRTLDPEGVYDFNHLYLDSASSPLPAAVTSAVGARSSAGAAAGDAAPALRVGMVDSGVDGVHPALGAVRFHAHGCEQHPVPAAHGTAVASLLVTSAHADPPSPPVELFAADVYCGDAAGGTSDALLEALAWLASEHVCVINVSLVGPANRLLEVFVRRLVDRGHIIVAPVGNDGPAAAPLYPAAYPGVVAVTGVDRHRRVLLEAGRGPHVEFSAYGADITAAAMSSGMVEVRGTSFASPIVAGQLAQRSLTLTRAASAAAIEALAVTAVDLGSRGRDPVYGYGWVNDVAHAAL
jgi:subtilisin family serine protease